MADSPVIRTVGLSKSFGAVAALRDLDLEIHPCEVFGHLGPNGGGKTTTLRLLMGMLRPTSGRDEVLGLDVWRDVAQVHRRIGYLSGEPALYGRLTGRQHGDYMGHLRGVGQTPYADDLAGRFDLDLGRAVGDLSKGNRQKLALALAIMSRPSLLVLDEPTGGLDPIAQQEFQTIPGEHASAGGSVLLSSHILGEVQRVAHRIGVLRA